MFSDSRLLNKSWNSFLQIMEQWKTPRLSQIELVFQKGRLNIENASMYIMTKWKFSQKSCVIILFGTEHNRYSVFCANPALLWVIFCVQFKNLLISLAFRYGFITFENQEDADRIIKKEVTCRGVQLPSPDARGYQFYLLGE